MLAFWLCIICIAKPIYAPSSYTRAALLRIVAHSACGDVFEVACSTVQPKEKRSHNVLSSRSSEPLKIWALGSIPQWWCPYRFAKLVFAIGSKSSELCLRGGSRHGRSGSARWTGFSCAGHRHLGLLAKGR